MTTYDSPPETEHKHHDGVQHKHVLTSTTGQHWHPPGGVPRAIGYGPSPTANAFGTNALQLTAADFEIELVY